MFWIFSISKNDANSGITQICIVCKMLIDYL